MSSVDDGDHPYMYTKQIWRCFGDTLTSPSADNVVTVTNIPTLGTYVVNSQLVISRPQL